MSQTFQIPRGATFPSIVIKMEERDQDGNWRAVQGLTGATVTFSMFENVAQIIDDNDKAQKVLNVDVTRAFEVGDKVIVARGTRREETNTIASIQDGVSITLVNDLAWDHYDADMDCVYVVKLDDVAGVVHDVDEALVRYDWSDGDTDIRTMYEAMFQAVTTSAKIILAPARDRDKLFVEVVASK